MKEDQCGCHWSRVVCPVNLKRKALIKIFLLQSSCAVRVKISGKLKFEVKKIYKRVHFDYLLVLNSVLLTESS